MDPSPFCLFKITYKNLFSIARDRLRITRGWFQSHKIGSAPHEVSFNRTRGFPHRTRLVSIARDRLGNTRGWFQWHKIGCAPNEVSVNHTRGFSDETSTE